MDTVVTAGGSVNATCATCHSSTYRDAHGAAGTGFSSTTKGSYVTCPECHGYNAAVSALTGDTVRTDTCAGCHTTGVLGSAHEQHATTAPSSSQHLGRLRRDRDRLPRRASTCTPFTATRPADAP